MTSQPKTPAAGSGAAGVKKFVGGFLSYDLVGRLSLYVLHNETTRAAVIEDLVRGLLRKGPSNETMIRSIARTLTDQWVVARTAGAPVTWGTYLRSTEKSLARKKVLERDASAILDEMKKLAETRKDFPQ